MQMATLTREKSVIGLPKIQIGENVCVELPEMALKEAQRGHGGWSMRMEEVFNITIMIFIYLYSHIRFKTRHKLDSITLWNCFYLYLSCITTNSCNINTEVGTIALFYTSICECVRHATAKTKNFSRGKFGALTVLTFVSVYW